MKIYLVGYTDDALQFFTNQKIVTPSTVATWQETDLSEYIPPEATGAIFKTVWGWSWAQIGARKKGSTDTFLTSNNGDMFHELICGVDDNRKVELYTEKSQNKIYLIGYTLPPVTIFTNAIEKTFSTSGSYLEFDFTAETSINATGLLLYRSHDASGAKTDLRAEGSTDDHSANGGFREWGLTVATVELDSNQVFEAYTNNVANKLYLIGYCEDGALPSTYPEYQEIAELWMDNTIAFMLRVDDLFLAFSEAFLDFVATNYPQVKVSMGIVTTRPDSEDWTKMKQLIEQKGYEVASHSRTHPNPPRTETEVKGAFMDIENMLEVPCIDYIFPGGNYDSNDLLWMQEYGVPVGGTIGGSTTIPTTEEGWQLFGSRNVEVDDTVRVNPNYANARTNGYKFFTMMLHLINWETQASMEEDLTTDLDDAVSATGNWFTTIEEFYSYCELRRLAAEIADTGNGTFRYEVDYSLFDKQAESTSNYTQRILAIPLTLIFRVHNPERWNVYKNGEQMTTNYEQNNNTGAYGEWAEGISVDEEIGTIYVNIIGTGEEDTISFTTQTEPPTTEEPTEPTEPTEPDEMTEQPEEISQADINKILIIIGIGAVLVLAFSIAKEKRRRKTPRQAYKERNKRKPPDLAA